jgi:hypothetical protein
MLRVRAGREVASNPLPLGSLFWYVKRMAKSITGTRKKRGRPPTGAESIHLRMLPDQLAALDEWIEKQREHRSRPEAIRQILERAFKPKGK